MIRIKRIIFIGFYIPGDASSNFVISFCKGYTEIGLEVKLLLQVNNEKDIPDVHGVDIFPIFPCGRVEREKVFRALIKQHFIKGETIVQHYGCPSWDWLPFRKKYPTFYTITEVPFADPNMPIRFKAMEWLKRLSTKQATGILVITNYLKDYFTKYGIRNIQVFNILIDPDRFKIVLKQKPEKFISYCGSVGVYKDGVGDLIEAYSIVRKTHPDVKLRIIGSFFTQQDKSIIMSKVAELQLEKDIVFTGRISPQDMPALLSDSCILALARPNNKQAQYGFPSKVGEYLFTGRPVVVTRVGELENFLKDNETCVFALPDNPINFAEKLIWVLEHPQQGDEIGRAGKLVAQSCFSIQSQCRVALDFFERSIR